MLDNALTNALRAPTDGSFRLENHDPAWSGMDDLQGLDGKHVKKQVKGYLKEQRKVLSDAQERLLADNRYALLVIFQAMDAAGKDSTIEHVMSGVNPQGCQVFSFKKPSETELDHNFMWRCWRALPERGRIGIFNRSYYEETLVVRVHPELLENQRLPPSPARSVEDFWQARFEDINAFEKHMTRNGTVIVKFFLNVSKNEQARRLIDRLTDPDKHWKFSADDLEKRSRWNDYQAAYQETIAQTSTPWAPWHVIPADDKWLMRGLVMSVICETVSALDIDFPKVPGSQMKSFNQALKTLKAETQPRPKSKK